MRDYGETLNSMRICLNVDRDSNCLSECFGCKYITHDHHVMDMVRDAADAIEELVAAVPKWISVEDRLPEDQGDDARAARGGDYIHKVLAASVTPNYTVMDTAYLENGIWSLSQYTSWKQIIGAPVTHWMPLPAPPKEELNKNVE